MLVDTHAHIASDAFADDVEAVLERAAAAGVHTVVCVADDVHAAKRGLELAERFGGRVVATAGIHPHQAGAATAEDLAELASIVDGGAVVAVGEMGLDYHYDFAPVDVQQEVFRHQLRLAKRVGLPVILHSRKAEHDVLRILEEEGADEIGGVMHCFWGDAEAARRTLDLGFYIGVGGPVTFKNTGDLREILAEVPLERMIIETDSPYLAPVPYRGKRNEPAYVAETAASLAALLGVPVATVAEQTTANARRLFQLDVGEGGK